MRMDDRTQRTTTDRCMKEPASSIGSGVTSNQHFREDEITSTLFALPGEYI